MNMSLNIKVKKVIMLWKSHNKLEEQILNPREGLVFAHDDRCLTKFQAYFDTKKRLSLWHLNLLYQFLINYA